MASLSTFTSSPSVMAAPSEICDLTFKIVLIGNPGVGKTAIIQRFRDNAFHDNLMSTTGCDFYKRTFQVRNKQVKLSVWDTAGQERFRTIIREFYRNAAAVVFVYSIVDRDSFRGLASWLEDVKASAHEDTMMFLVGNKADLVNQRQVTAEASQNFAMTAGMNLIETSAKTGHGVENLFSFIATRLEEAAALQKKSDNRISTISVLQRQTANFKLSRTKEKRNCCALM